MSWRDEGVAAPGTVIEEKFGTPKPDVRGEIPTPLRFLSMETAYSAVSFCV
jgi:hypothetical protein